jgi:hypothetical protein
MIGLLGAISITEVLVVVLVVVLIVWLVRR